MLENSYMTVVLLCPECVCHFVDIKWQLSALRVLSLGCTNMRQRAISSADISEKSQQYICRMRRYNAIGLTNWCLEVKIEVKITRAKYITSGDNDKWVERRFVSKGLLQYSNRSIRNRKSPQAHDFPNWSDRPSSRYNGRLYLVFWLLEWCNHTHKLCYKLLINNEILEIGLEIISVFFSLVTWLSSVIQVTHLFDTSCIRPQVRRRCFLNSPVVHFAS